MKECIICKNEFKRKVWNQKCCSLECSKKHKQNYNTLKKRKNYILKYQQTDKYKLYKKRYRKTNTDKEYQKKYKQTDKFKSYQKQWNRTAKGKFNHLKKYLKRRERENNCIHKFTIAEWKLKCDACNGFCPSCNKSFDCHLHKLTLDHILALYWANKYFKATGMKWVYTINQIQPLCLSCNSSKQHKTII